MEYMHQLFRPFWTVVLDFGGTQNKSYLSLSPEEQALYSSQS